MSYNLITFSNYFHWVHTENGCLVRAAIGVSVANYTRKRRNVIKLHKNFVQFESVPALSNSVKSF